VKRDLQRAAELRLGTKLSQPKSLFDFWKNHIKERPVKKEEFSVSIVKAPRPATADAKSVITDKTGTSKKKETIELQTIYDTYKNSKAADINKTLQEIEKEEKLMKERVDAKMKIEKKNAQKQQREETVKAEIEEYFKRYMDKKTADEITNLEKKRADIELIRQRRARSRSKSPAMHEGTRRIKPQNKSPIHLEGSLDIDESKATEVVEESLALKKKGKKVQKTPKKLKIAELVEKYTQEEIIDFDYDKERAKMTETLKLYGKVYAF
jgi:hypothetical protein